MTTISPTTSTLEFTHKIMVDIMWIAYTKHDALIEIIFPVGIMRITSLNYDSATHTLMCTSTGGPATTVLWSKDNSSRIDDQHYELSMLIIDKTTATYESRLRILNKSSKQTGNYTCTVSNSGGSSRKSKYLEGK